MSGHRLLAVAAASLLALGCAGSAFAATPQKIYRDLTDNGRLDGTYTRAEIERAFDLPPKVRTDPSPATPRRPIGVPAAGEAAPPSAERSRPSRRVPFSSLDAALLVAGGGPLLLIGAGLRRRAVSTPARPRVVSS
ncbi:MAG TPA: hypothetical protein VFL61_16925 [Gaiellaceae bacterium]|nr:hypothetical protein [Gaiellaceae bacterium]